jgi:hypothetical protein
MIVVGVKINPIKTLAILALLENICLTIETVSVQTHFHLTLRIQGLLCPRTDIAMQRAQCTISE